MSVPITYRQKMDFSFCVYMVGFPKYGHICVSTRILNLERKQGLILYVCSAKETSQEN